MKNKYTETFLNENKDKKGEMCSKSAGFDMQEKGMLGFLMNIANTGDSTKPWLIAICMIVSIVVVVGLFILGQRSKDADEKKDDSNEGLF